MKGIIASSSWPRQSSLLGKNESKSKNYGNTRANMSTMMKEGVTMHYKPVKTNLLH